MVISDCDSVNRTMGCFRDPPDCMEFRDPNSLDYDPSACNFVIRWQQTFDKKSVNFEVYARPEEENRNEYVAMALSRNQKMVSYQVLLFHTI